MALVVFFAKIINIIVFWWIILKKKFKYAGKS